MSYFLQSMTAKQFAELVNNWDEHSWEKLVIGNTKLAYKIANAYYCQQLDREELFGFSLVGLVRAAQTFDHTSGNKFSTYASYVIKNELNVAIRQNHRHVIETVSLNNEIESDNGELVELVDLVGSSFDVYDELNRKDIKNRMLLALNSQTERNRNIILDFLHEVEDKKLLPSTILLSPMFQELLNSSKKKCISKIIKIKKDKITC